MNAESIEQESLTKLKRAAEESVMLLQGPALKDLLKYIDLLYAIELASMPGHYDEVHLRQSQGSCKTYAAVLHLLQHRPVDVRRSASRREV